MSLAAFTEAVTDVARSIEGKTVEPGLAATLHQAFPPDGDAFLRLETLTRQGVAEGWLANREAGGIQYGRVIKPSPASHGFSVDVVVMDDIEGPHHAHPNGEIDLILPVTEGARFDGAPRGWLVYGPGSRHKPTVSGGKAIVLYLLPGGAIDFHASP